MTSIILNDRLACQISQKRRGTKLYDRLMKHLKTRLMNRHLWRIANGFALVIFIAIGNSLAPIGVRAEGISVLRDTEIEQTVRALATPIWRAAKLDPEAVKFILVNDESLNAFVAGGQNLFLNSGLILRAENASQLIGVIAHETGHMAGGHLVRSTDAITKSQITSLLGIVLGGAAAVISGNPAAIVAGATAGPSMAQRQYFAFSRGIEGSADNAGLRYLETTQESAQGFLEFMTILQTMDQSGSAKSDPYLLTHPLSSERVENVRNFLSHSKYAKTPTDPKIEIQFNRIRSKLSGFLDPIGKVLTSYPLSRNDIEARYARAIAYSRIPDNSRAFAQISSLLADYPNDPYFWELKGQIHFQTGQFDEALKAYLEAVKFNPNAPLIRIDLARVMIETNDPSLLEAAKTHLMEATIQEDDLSSVWFNLGIVYGRLGDRGESELCLAKQAYLERRLKQATVHAELALKFLAADKKQSQQRARDILEQAKQAMASPKG